MTEGVVDRVDRMEKKLDKTLDGLYGDDHRQGFIDIILENQKAIQRNQESLHTIEQFIRLEVERRNSRRRTGTVSALLTPLFAGLFTWMLFAKVGVVENQAEATAITAILFVLASGVVALLVLSLESLFR